jgi:hypothetical protein
MVMNNLRSELEKIANEFVSSLLSAMQSAPLADVAERVNARAGGTSGRRVKAGGAVPTPRAVGPRSIRGRRRASAAEVQHLKDVAYRVAKALGKEFSKGDIMKKSRSKVDLGRALTLLVAEGKLTKRGDRRLTRYFITQ